MKKAYIQPEIELLKVSALNDFLVVSPNESTDAGIGDELLGDDDWNGNEWA